MSVCLVQWFYKRAVKHKVAGLIPPRASFSKHVVFFIQHALSDKTWKFKISILQYGIEISADIFWKSV